MCHFGVQNDPLVLNKFFLVQAIIITAIYLLALVIAQNLRKTLTADPKLWDAPFRAQNAPFAAPPHKMAHLPKSKFFQNTP